jgi:hypothetical protein
MTHITAGSFKFQFAFLVCIFMFGHATSEVMYMKQICGTKNSSGAAE